MAAVNKHFHNVRGTASGVKRADYSMGEFILSLPKEVG
jgi:hypothetical protein